MTQISQNPDGTYIKTYSDTELMLIRSLQTEIKERSESDQELLVQIMSLENRVKILEDDDINLADLRAAITQNVLRLDAHEERITYLEQAVIVDAYSKKEMDPYMIPWKVEQIPHVFDIPTNEMFNRADIDVLKTGYMHFHRADIDEPHDHHIPENTMRRYTISAFMSVPKTVTFNIYFADRCSVYIDDKLVAQYVDSYGNFGGTAKVLTHDFKEGWSKIQFLIANETQQGGLKIVSNLYEQADYLANIDYIYGMISGNRIQDGAIESRHMSPNMDLVVNTITATASDVPSGMFGDPEACGMIRIGDGIITKCKDEPYVFDNGIRVEGYIRVSQLLIDKDFIRAGKGIIVDAIKDAETGFTQMYEIINDLRLINGGGLIIAGNAQDGYTITNDLQIIGHPDGGIKVTGNPIDGYMIENIMKLSSYGGIQITGNATIGYFLKNTMILSSLGGIEVEGNAAEGYSIKNTMKLTSLGGIEVKGNAAEGYTVKNTMKLDSLGGIEVKGNAADGYTVKNTMKLKASQGIDVSGDAVNGYHLKNQVKLTGEGIKVNPTIVDGNAYAAWHLINDTQLLAGRGISIDKLTPAGTFRINSQGVLGIRGDKAVTVQQQGDGQYVVSAEFISVTGSGVARVTGSHPRFNVHVDPINIYGSGMAQVTGYYPNFNVYVPPVEQVSISGSWPIIVQRNGNNYNISFDNSAIPEVPEIPEIPYIPPGNDGGGGGSDKDYGDVLVTNNHTGGGISRSGIYYIVDSGSQSELGIANSTIRIGKDSSTLRVMINKVGALTLSNSAVWIKVVVKKGNHDGAIITQSARTVSGGSKSLTTPDPTPSTGSVEFTFNVASSWPENIYVGVYTSQRNYKIYHTGLVCEIT